MNQEQNDLIKKIEITKNKGENIEIYLHFEDNSILDIGFYLYMAGVI